MSNSSVTIEPGFRGTVSGLTRARYHQRATVSITNATGRTFAVTTLVGGGENVSMTQEVNPTLSAWSFGPFTEAVTINVAIDHSEQSGGNFLPSKVILPVTVKKEADPISPQTFVVSTLLSEDNVDNDFNDCIVTVLQYK